MSGGEGTQIERLRELFEAFQHKRELLALLEGCARSPGVRLFIGEESGFGPLSGYSLVSAPYGGDGHVLGAIGVIGPTRMAYHSVIPVVQATATLLTDALRAPE
jgi:heat-inducible transcriptional repressor